MIHNNVELVILVKGRPITEYNHRGQVFIEGRDGSEYEVEIRNNTHGRIEAVLSVDGLSVIDGKAAGVQSSGYLIEARKSVRIPGWTLDNANVAKFAFAGKQESYATQMSGESHNNGVIGVMAFSEKYTPPQYQYSQYSQQFIPNYTLGGASTLNNVQSYNSSSLHEAYRGAKKATRSHTSYGIAASAASYNAPSVSTTITDQSYYDASAATPMDDFVAQSMVQNSLGTAFGDSTSFATTKVEFSRGDMLSYQIIYYDEARGLKARGIQMVKPSKKKYQKKPDAFPAMSPEGCSPPPDWRG